MEVKVTARKTITGNSSSDGLGKIIEAQILFRNPLETVQSNVEWMSQGDDYRGLLFPLDTHGVVCL